MLSRSRFKIEMTTKLSNSSKMELKHTNLNGEIVLVKDLNLKKLFFFTQMKNLFILKNCEN